MGVPALFRWLSKKYPKIVVPVVEEEETTITDDDGDEIVKPIDYTTPNPNGEEFDNLYLDMNGIVHPCTHPEGKPAPETEEEMMVEVFNYTERVVNMIRPRKLLMIAIDGVAPRAKMNQQRSRRFRASQEAKEKEEARQEGLLLWEAMGKTITDDMRSKKAWDSNAITPGTPFMDLLAQSLRYWVVRKMNTDPGWKQLEVIISDASVPGEGEHKIMDFIRRQRTNPGHDPNTRHVIYGLDADLIMLSLATHEPHFRVLREDVFFQDTSPTACRICGQEGHYAAQCTGEKKEKIDEHDTKSAPPTKKPFIFLDVAILREYLEVELNVPNAPFQFDIERAFDDWVLMIFFVGNDFLPHLPSLEIREGAIDKLLKIWKAELPRMGGYITNHGKLEFERAEIILEGLARLEDDIFRSRREAEERQDRNAKRRKLEAEARNGTTSAPAAPPLVTGPYGLPPRPSFNTFEETANSLGLGTTTTTQESANGRMAALAEAADKGRQIRDANLSAAEMLKAELMSPIPANPVARKKYMAQKAAAMKVDVIAKSEVPPSAEPPSGEPEPTVKEEPVPTVEEEPVPTADEQPVTATPPEASQLEEPVEAPPATVVDGDSSPHGVKRKADELDAEGEDDEDFDLGPEDEEEEEASQDTSIALARKVNPDGTVEQEDRVKLYEPGYRERYYMLKFGVEFSDVAFRKKITTAYIEGMAWVLQYYYQGTPSWTWYYPYHFAPFAQDFEGVSKMTIEFNKGQPFKPFEQLMGVFPPASRKHIPEVFHGLMIDDESPIRDFYPETFEIDMNGKKMAWQGVALLPFIDEQRLLEAMATCYPGLTEEEIKRNTWGTNVLFVADEHPLYPVLESLYTKRKHDNPVPIDPNQSKGLNGSLLPDPNCVPGSTYFSPLTSQGLDDIAGDCSLAAIYFFPKQLAPHHSVLLPGLRRPKRVLTKDELDDVRYGRREGGGRRSQRDAGFHAINSGREGGRGLPRNGSYGGQSYGGYGGDGRDGRNSYGGGYGGSGYGGYGGYGNGSGQYANRGAPPPRGRDDYNRPSYSGPPSRSSYQTSFTAEYNRPSNPYNYGGGARGGRGGGANGYSGPPPRSSSFGSTQSARYGGAGGPGGGYTGGYNQSQTASYSQNYSTSNTGYGGSSRTSFGGYGGANANSGGGYGGYGGDRGGAPNNYAGYGRGQGGGSSAPYGGHQASYSGYGRGGGPPTSAPYSGQYSGRGRGYGRY